MITADRELIEAADSLRRALDHEVHAKILRRGYRKVKRILREYWQAQKRAILAAVRGRIRVFAEADHDSDTRARRILPDTVLPLSFSVTSLEAAAYAEAITAAINAAGAQLAKELGQRGVLPQTVAGDYLKEHSLSKLTGGFSETTKQRLRDAIADAFQTGGTADDIVQAIKDTMDGFSDARADLVAQTEVNQAYVQGRVAMAVSIGFTEKAWITESGNPCPICIGNEDQGYIPMDEYFESGDLQPTAHPNCMCSVDFRKIS